MLTLFATPKAFRGHNATIQRNAIQSWTKLSPACQIILIGNDEGVAECAEEFGLLHIPQPAVNDFGTPLISDLFEQGRKHAIQPILCYINADIILFNDFLEAVDLVRKSKPQFMMCGQRWDFDIETPLDFNDPAWERKLRDDVAARGVLHPTSGIDYFVHTPGAFDPIPKFAIGRGKWDNWLLLQVRRKGLPLVDSSAAMVAVHQNHDYAHISPESLADLYKNNPEFVRNAELAGPAERLFQLDDATVRIVRDGSKLRLQSHWTKRHFARLGHLYPWLAPIIEPGFKYVGLARRKMGLVKPE